ncbi:MAG: oligosaccharide flippase family protein [archaeon]|jgi:O-antigen/teichoic acid export membrane protein|nr:oligosaccharide flippase family protein [archaeon]
MERGEANLGKSLHLIAKSTIIVFVGIFLSKLFTYVYRIVIARYYGPEVYGLLSLALMVAGWFTAFSALGLSEGLLRYIAVYRAGKKADRIRYLIKFSLAILGFSSIFAGVLLYFTSDLIAVSIFKSPELAIFLKIFAFCVPITVLLGPFLSTLRAFERINLYSGISNILQNAAKLAIILLFIFVGVNSGGVALSYVLGMLATLIAAYLACRYYLPQVFGAARIPGAERTEIMKEVFSYSWPLLFLGFFTSVFYWLDTFAIGFFRTTMEVGIYNAAIPLSLLLFFVPELFTQLFFPMITKEFSRKNVRLVREMTQQVGKWIFALNLPVLMIMVLFPGVVLNVFFGSEYLAAEMSLRLLAIGALFASVTGLSTNLLSAIGKSRLIFYNFVAAAIVNFVLNWMLVPDYGMVGAAFATMITYFVLGTMALVQARRYTKIIPVRRKMGRIFMISLLLGGIVWFVSNNIEGIGLGGLIVIGALYFAAYLALMFSTKSFDKNDFGIMKSTMVKLGIPGVNYLFD